MEIYRKSCAQGAREAEGLTVIIDVFRAFSCAPLFFHFGAARVFLEADPEKARRLKRDHPAWVLVGEVNEVPLQDADLGNSPSQIIRRGEDFFRGRTVVHRTTAGVTGVAAASRAGASKIILGSFVMARAIGRYIAAERPGRVTLVAMGDRALQPAAEDEACADYLQHLLTGTPYDPISAYRRIVFQPTAQKFLTRAQAYLPPEDPVFCLQRDLFDVALFAAAGADGLEVYQVPVPAGEHQQGRSSHE